MIGEFLSIAEGWTTGAMIIRMVCALLVGTIIGIDRAMKAIWILPVWEPR